MKISRGGAPLPVKNAQPTDAVRTRASTPGAAPAPPATLEVKASVVPRPVAPWAARSRQLANEALDAAGARENLSPAQLKSAVAQLKTAAELGGAKISLGVVPLAGGPALVKDASDAKVNPASNSKLATACAVMTALGPDFTFKTPVATDASGNLHIQGAFDPSMTDETLQQVALALRQRGVTQVENIVLDTSALVGTRTPAHFGESGDNDFDYLTRPEALAVNKNVIEIHVAPTSPGEAPVITSPNDELAFKSRVTTVEPGTQFHIGVDEEDTHGTLVRDAASRPIVDLWGNIAADYTKGKDLVMKGPAPVETFGAAMKRALVAAGIEVTGQVETGPMTPQPKVEFTQVSAPLGELLKTSLAASNAFDFEMYSLAAEAHANPAHTATISDAVARTNAFLENTLHFQGAHLENASGINHANTLTADQLVAMLQYSARTPAARNIVEGLARPGMAGTTLTTRMLDTPAESRIRAKTGTLTGTAALSGVVDLEGKNPLAFSCVVSHLPGGAEGRQAGRAWLDALGIVLAAAKTN